MTIRLYRLAPAGFAAVLLLCAAARAADGVPRLLWHDPGDVSNIDLGGSVNTGIPAPRPPYTFVKEDMGGTQPKVLVKDAAARLWDIKFGFEVKPECFTWRIPVAVGYFVEPSYFVPSGRIVGFQPLKRSTPSLQPDGQFKDARFQVRDPNFKYLEGQAWKWTGNPFSGTSQLKGLEILIMLASNWDNKDATWGPGNANTGMFERTVNGRRQLIYSFTDWGSGMGSWGDKTGQTDWSCKDYSSQTPQFVKGVNNGRIVFGYEGHHNEGFKTGIRPADVAWLMRYLGQVSDAQIEAALRATGAAAADQTCFTRAIRLRIEQLRAVSKGASGSGRPNSSRRPAGAS